MLWVPPDLLVAADEARATAHRFLAGQDWFRDAPAMVVMVARFERLFWKYRRHTKAWRVVHLDVGHLSQTSYLSATELGLGSFVTAAIKTVADTTRELIVHWQRVGFVHGVMSVGVQSRI